VLHGPRQSSGAVEMKASKRVHGPHLNCVVMWFSMFCVSYMNSVQQLQVIFPVFRGFIKYLKGSVAIDQVVVTYMVPF